MTAPVDFELQLDDCEAVIRAGYEALRRVLRRWRPESADRLLDQICDDHVKRMRGEARAKWLLGDVLTESPRHGLVAEAPIPPRLTILNGGKP